MGEESGAKDPWGPGFGLTEANNIDPTKNRTIIIKHETRRMLMTAPEVTRATKRAVLSAINEFYTASAVGPHVVCIAAMGAVFEEVVRAMVQQKGMSPERAVIAARDIWKQSADEFVSQYQAIKK